MTERTLILGTAGHIDHGKTALVKSLTGVDTDRLKEEKERGITIDLGFAEFSPGGGVHFGVVDVPGHEGFIRNMLAGATGIDLVMLVVAADEGVMPQTREHVDIVRLLGVEAMVVALTKADLVDEEWLDLALEDVKDLLVGSVFEGVPIIPTSVTDGRGVDELCAALIEAARSAESRAEEDLARLPIDRIFTVHGTGTVLTGTMWTGSLEDGSAVRLLPKGLEARVRGLQVHGTATARAVAGQRTAVAITGTGLKREDLERGATLLTSAGWTSSSMLTVWLSVLDGSDWEMKEGQRVRVHLGTAEVMARVRLLGGGDLSPGQEGWAQLRLEVPLVARGGDRLVIRSYSPVTTIGGGVVVEPDPPKRKTLDPELADRFESIRVGDPVAATRAALDLRGWSGASDVELQILTGLTPARVLTALEALTAEGARDWGGSVVSARTVGEGRSLLLEEMDRFHIAEPLRPGLPLERLRQALPAADPRIVEGLVAGLVEEGLLEVGDGVARRAGFQPELSARQEKVREELLETFRQSGLSPPSVGELPAPLREHEDLWPILKLLEAAGALIGLGNDLFVDANALDGAERAVRGELGGRTGLGPSDFRDALPVTRKHLIPLLAHFDRTGVTIRGPEGREVVAN